MRFTLIKDIKRDNTMKPIINGLLLFTLLYLVSDFFVSYHSFGLFSQQLKNTLFGNMEEFIEPISKGALLEYLHTQIFFMMMLLLTLSAIFARLCSKKRYMLTLINTVMLSAILTIIALAFTYFLTPLLLNLYIISYFTWHTAALFMVLISLWSLNRDSSV